MFDIAIEYNIKIVGWAKSWLEYHKALPRDQAIVDELSLIVIDVDGKIVIPNEWDNLMALC